MQQPTIFLYSPGGENDGSNTLSNNIEDSVTGKETDAKKVEEDEKKPFMEKVQDALQEWSNDDQRDQEFDDTRP